MERVSDLRRVAQAGKDTDPAGYRIHRRISIYLTWWLLRLGVSANQASLLMMIVGAAGAMLLASPRLGLDAVGFSLLYVAFLLDKVDGEIARCRRSESPRGILLDRFHHRIVEPAVFAAAAWREYGLTSSATPLVAGFATMLFANIIEENQQLAPFIVHKRLREGGRLPPDSRRARSRALARAAALLRPLKLFRMQIGALPLLAAAYAVETATGRPAPAWCLLASAVGLGVYLVFQCLYYYLEQLESETQAVAAVLGDARTASVRQKPAQDHSRTGSAATNGAGAAPVESGGFGSAAGPAPAAPLLPHPFGRRPQGRTVRDHEMGLR